MKLTALRPMIYTDHLEDTIRFYTDVLGFTLAGKNDDWGWASL
ncbi:VOC family protein [Niabella defluvii]|nr:VOC family protein [Niabella sp. I65]